MAKIMTSQDPKVQKLVKLLQEDFELPEIVQSFTVEVSIDDVVRISVAYIPSTPETVA